MNHTILNTVQIESTIVEAIKSFRNESPTERLTVIVPSKISALQWRRRVAISCKMLFNVRFIDLNQLALDLLSAGNESLGPKSEPVQLATAWLVLQETKTDLKNYKDNPDMPAQLLRAFDILDGASDDEKSTVNPDVIALYQQFVEKNKEVGRDSILLEKAIESIEQNGLPKDEQFILLNSESISPLQNKLTQLLNTKVKRVVEIDSSFDHTIAKAELLDELDEINWILSEIQDAATLQGIPVHEMAVILPNQNPYGKLFENEADKIGLIWNGTSTRKLEETIPGQQFASIEIRVEATWKEQIESFIDNASRGKKGYKSKPYQAILQTFTDEFEVWNQIEKIVPRPNISLVQTLLKRVMSKPVGRNRSFGDGVFVGNLQGLEGLSFQRIFIPGCSEGNIQFTPSKNPLLPSGLGAPNSELLQKHINQQLDWSASIYLCYSRSDRRNSRESFPSPWLSDLSGEAPKVSQSIIDLLSETGPRSESQQKLADALSNRTLASPVSKMLKAFESDNVTDEAQIQNKVAGISADLLTDIEHLSSTQIDSFLRCPRQWYYKYKLNLKEPKEILEIGFTDLVKGSIIHQVLAKLFTDNLKNLENTQFAWNENHFSTVKEDIISQATKDKGAELINYELDGVTKWASDVKKLLLFDNKYRSENHAVPILIEQELVGNIEGIEFAGKADRIDRHLDGTYSIIDYKTGASSRLDTKRLAADAKQPFPTLQGAIYANLVLQSSNKLEIPSDAAITSRYFRMGQPVDKIESHQDYRSFLLKFTELMQVISNMMTEGLVPMVPIKDGQEVCGYCPFTNICPAEKEALFERTKLNAKSNYGRFLNLQNLMNTGEEN